MTLPNHSITIHRINTQGDPDENGNYVQLNIQRRIDRVHTYLTLEAAKRLHQEIGKLVAKPDLYWLADDGEESYPNPNEFVSNGMDLYHGKIYTFTTALTLADEKWQAVAVNDADEPCPKCGGKVECEPGLGDEGCEAETLMLVKVG